MTVGRRSQRLPLVDAARGTDKQGPVWVRWILCEAAQKARHSPQFAASYQSIANRRGTKIATTAIARKLLTRACHLLTDASSCGAPC
jgi:transposase